MSFLGLPDVFISIVPNQVGTWQEGNWPARKKRPLQKPVQRPVILAFELLEL